MAIVDISLKEKINILKRRGFTIKIDPVGEYIVTKNHKKYTIDGALNALLKDTLLGGVMQVATGTIGAPGEQGPPGVAGTDGYTPIKGIDYFDGAKGDTGSQGLQGEQGIQGIPGEAGSQGIQGIQGIQGEQGLPGLDADVTEHESTFNHGNYNTAYSHSQITHAPPTAQINSDITKGEIEAKLIGEISSHSHAGGGGGLSQAQVLTRML